jgi:hypothetical protein
VRLTRLVVLLAFGACTHLPGFLRGDDAADESLYRRAVHYLDPANERASLDSAQLLLDRYLASDGEKDRVGEAIVLRRLIDEAQELARVEAVLRQHIAGIVDQRQDTTTRREVDTVRVQTKQAEGARPRPSAEAAREIQRLREELREANAELARIRRRLAAPRDSTDSK